MFVGVEGMVAYRDACGNRVRGNPEAARDKLRIEELEAENALLRAVTPRKLVGDKALLDRIEYLTARIAALEGRA